jgi:hypothetical protein
MPVIEEHRHSGPNNSFRSFSMDNDEAIVSADLERVRLEEWFVDQTESLFENCSISRLG